MRDFQFVQYSQISAGSVFFYTNQSLRIEFQNEPQKKKHKKKKMESFELIPPCRNDEKAKNTAKQSQMQIKVSD